jgi:hypothetical protein
LTTVKMWNIPSNSNPHMRDNILDMLYTLGKWMQKGATLSVSLLRQLQAWICEVLQSKCSPLIRSVLDQPSYLPKFDNLGGEILALHCVCVLFMCVFELAHRRYCYFFQTDIWRRVASIAQNLFEQAHGAISGLLFINV